MLSLFATLALAVQIAAPVQDTAQARREELMSKLRSGGYSVLMRHARTDYSTQEPMGTIPAERSKQRNLSDDGISDAALMGVVFRRYGVSFAEVVSSPMFRTVETAEMAAGKPRTTMALRAIPATPEQEALVRAAPKAGTNRLLVTHHFVIEKHVPGITPGAVAESEAAVVSHAPDGSLRLVGIIHLADWKALANPGKPSAPTAAAGGATSPHAPPAHARVSIPNTPAAQLAHGYIGSFNSGEAAAMRSFMQSSFVADSTRPIEARVASYLKLFADHGPLSLVSIDSSTATRIVIGMQAKTGPLTLTIEASDADPKRAKSVTFAFRGAHG